MQFLILGTGTLVSAIALGIIKSFDLARLEAFGPTARVYWNGIENGLIASTIILAVSLAIYVFFHNRFEYVEGKWKAFFSSLSETRKNLLVLGICVVFAFASHAGNIIDGFFNMDDLTVIGVNNSISFGESVMLPYGNDHLVPLFKTEMKVLGELFGQNPIPYNIFFFLLFALTPFFIYLAFKNLRLKGFGVFLVLFAGATSWADMLTGFCIMTIYTQVIAFFSASIWAYTAWLQSREKKYLGLLTLFMILALAADTSGIWTLPAIFLLIVTVHYMKSEGFKNFWREQKAPLLTAIGVAVLFAIFMYVSFAVIQPDTFLSRLSGDWVEGTPIPDDKTENWRPIPLTTNFLSFFSNGVSLTLIAPNLVKLLVHPVMKNAAVPLWPYIETIIVLLNAGLIWLIIKKASTGERKLAVFLLINIFMTVSMVILARPNHEIIPDFDYRYAGAPFFFYCLLLSLGATRLIKANKKNALRIVIPLVIVIFAAQQAFGFYAVRLKEEAKLRKEAFVKLDQTLLKDLAALSKDSASLIVPDLAGASIFQPMPGFTLANYLLFYDTKFPISLVRNSAMQPESGSDIVTDVASLRASTSKEFKDTLKTPGAVREYYASANLMIYKTFTDETTLTSLAQNTKSDIVIKSGEFDPEKTRRVSFTLYTDDVPGNLELALSFKNDFGVTENAGRIRIDDYTKHTAIDGKRAYRIETDLLQLYTYSLSQRVSNIILHIPETKNAYAGNVSFK